MLLIPLGANLVHVFVNKNLQLLLWLEAAVDMDFTGPMESIGPVLSKFPLNYLNLLGHSRCATMCIFSR